MKVRARGNYDFAFQISLQIEARRRVRNTCWRNESATHVVQCAGGLAAPCWKVLLEIADRPGLLCGSGHGGAQKHRECNKRVTLSAAIST